MSLVVALVANNLETFPSEDQVPIGGRIISDVQELAELSTSPTLDAMTTRLLGESSITPSPSVEAAANRLWVALTAGKSGLAMSKTHTPVDNFGNRKFTGGGKIELIEVIFSPGSDYMVDHFYKKFPRQIRKMVDVIMDAGRLVMTPAQVDQVLLARKSEITSGGDVLSLFVQHRSDFFLKKILRRLSYAEFSSNPKYSGVSLE